jgi:LacI family transcriptional regulator
MADLTLEDIAQQAGVSRSTVSRVLNHQPNVRKAVRERVQDVIEGTGFRPHAAARALASQRSSIFGLVIPHSVSFFFTDPYCSHLTKGIAQACNQHNYTLALFLVDTKEDEKKIFTSVTRKDLLGGVLVQSGHYGDQQIIGYLVDANMPQVVIGRPFRSNNVSYVDIDNINAAFNAVTHLVRIGYKRIGTITGPEHSTAGLDRKAGYIKALNERGFSIDESLIVEGDFTESGGYYAMKKLLSAKPEAIFAASDLMAVGAMHAVREAGLHIPSDVAFVGFDDFPAATLSDVQLTTIRQPVTQFGAKAVEILIDLVEHGVNPPRHIIMETELVIRESCGASCE